jgi:iron complex transport system ATP-binding protein
MIITEDLRFSYGDRPILDGLDLRVDRGEIVGIVGPNGAGKTTLLKLISGVMRPTGGRVVVDGMDFNSTGDAERARLVSVVPQNPQLPAGYRALDVVLMGRNPHLRTFEWEGAHDVELAARAMRLTDVWEMAARPISSLSGGERQRTVLAMALAQASPVMLLDEPTTNLDLAHQIGIMDLVRGLLPESLKCAVVAMHDLTLAAQYCDRLVMLSEGKSYAEGPPSEVLTEENIRAVYGASVFVVAHPQSGTPVVLPASKASRGALSDKLPGLVGNSSPD